MTPTAPRKRKMAVTFFALAVVFALTSGFEFATGVAFSKRRLVRRADADEPFIMLAVAGALVAAGCFAKGMESD
jgi:hypothetical protein